LRVVNPVPSYRWLLDGGPHGYQWLNGAGLHGHDVPDAADFRLGVFEPPPAWATGSMYQIFPDRFAKAVERPAPPWVVPAAWDDPPHDGAGDERIVPAGRIEPRCMR
jgi:alpha-glucosidase